MDKNGLITEVYGRKVFNNLRPRLMAWIRASFEKPG